MADLSTRLEAAVGSGYSVTRASDAKELLQISGELFDAVLVDLSLPGLDAVLPLVIERASAPVVVIAPPDQPALGLAALRLGAADYLRQPVEPAEVRFILDKVLSADECAAEEPPPSIARPSSPMIGASAVMTELASSLARAARSVATVLVRGESGTGKELIARQLHAQSQRSAGPFIKVHAGALPDNLLESELFGYEKGAFTGATARKPGRVEIAEGGTLFLDEIGDITPAIQVKLLRILQDREYERLGGNETLKANVRFVAATHRDLEAMVKAGTFREDLFYRLSVVSLWAPALRDRRPDIAALAQHFARAVARENGRPEVELDAGALALLEAQPWPGNVRQLQNFIERLVVMGEATRYGEKELRAELVRARMSLSVAVMQDVPLSKQTSVTELDEAVRRAEKRALEKALLRANGNRTLAARILGVSRRKLFYKLQEHEVR